MDSVKFIESYLGVELKDFQIQLIVDHFSKDEESENSSQGKHTL